MSNKTRREEYSQGFPAGFEGFEDLKDPRKGKYPRHFFGEVIFIALAAMVCGSESFEDFERFARGKQTWLRKYIKLPGGIPSNDTFRRIFTAMDPDQFCAGFVDFIKRLNGELGDQLIAIDGKTLRHSFDDSDPTKSLHLISAWACDSQLTLGQLKVDGKTNEITTIPLLLDRLDIDGHTISLDAMGCQKNIAKKIHLANADYLLAFKGNHEHLLERVTEFFSSPGHIRYAQRHNYTLSSDETRGQGHGRMEERVILATDCLDFIDKNERGEWLGLKSIVCVESHREVIKSKTKSVQRRYYLTSHKPDGPILQKLIRQHWSIENQCHWILDVSFDEDQCRARKGNAAANLAMLRKTTLSLLKHDTTVKDSIKGKRFQAVLNEETLEKFLLLEAPR